MPEPEGATRRPFTITKVERAPEGYWTAHVTAQGGKPIAVDTRYGAWQARVGEQRREVMPAVARALQERVRPLEKAERDERAAVKERAEAMRREGPAAVRAAGAESAGRIPVLLRSASSRRASHGSSASSAPSHPSRVRVR